MKVPYFKLVNAPLERGSGDESRQVGAEELTSSEFCGVSCRSRSSSLFQLPERGLVMVDAKSRGPEQLKVSATEMAIEGKSLNGRE